MFHRRKNNVEKKGASDKGEISELSEAKIQAASSITKNKAIYNFLEIIEEKKMTQYPWTNILYMFWCLLLPRLQQIGC